jgi:hypothetical protein
MARRFGTAFASRRWRLGTALIVLLAGLCGALQAHADRRHNVTTLHMDAERTLQWVARDLGIELRDDIPRPRIRLASETPLREFQDAIEAQWHVRPPLVFNVYVIARNEIFLDDTSDYYRRRHRTLDDSLAHELVHYLQVRYQNDDLATDASELEASTVQAAFRDAHFPALANAAK